MEEQLSEEEKVKVEKFLSAFKDLTIEHGYDFGAIVEVAPTGIIPKIRIFRVPPKEEKVV